MKDNTGVYYYPFPQNKKVRMYVRQKGDDIEFRMKNDDDPKMWTEHGWVSYAAIVQAKILYEKKGGFDPGKAYDISAAKELIKEHRL